MVALVAFFFMLVRTERGEFQGIFTFAFSFLPVAATYAFVSTLLLRRVARSRPALSTRLLLFRSHILAVFAGLTLALITPKFF